MTTEVVSMAGEELLVPRPDGYSVLDFLSDLINDAFDRALDLEKPFGPPFSQN